MNIATIKLDELLQLCIVQYTLSIRKFIQPEIYFSGFGKDWYDTGIKEKIQNSFDDFLAAVKFLIDNK